MSLVGVEESGFAFSAFSSFDSSISSSDFLEMEFVFDASFFNCLFMRGSSKKWKSLE